MSNPKMILLSKGRNNSATVLIKGFLSANDDIKDDKPWIESIRKIGLKGDIYKLWWDSLTVFKFLLPTFIPSPTILRFIASNPASIPVSILATIGVNIYKWKAAQARAKMVGERFFSNEIKQLKHDSINIVAHSLGARVLYYGLLKYYNINPMHYQMRHHSKIDNVFITGGAQRRRKDWDKAADRINRTLYNIYNPNDFVLKYIYPVSRLTAPGNPCGLQPIKTIHPRIANISIDHIVDSGYANHAKYHKVIHRVIKL